MRRSERLLARARRRFKPYPAYKDSGVEWLGKIPAHWDMTKMWAVAEANSGATPPKEILRYWDGGIPWVSPKDMKRRFIDSSEDTVSELAISEAGLKLVPDPAVLVVVRGMILAHSFPVGVTRMPVTINQDMKALRLGEQVKPEFFAWWLVGIGPQLLTVVVDEAAHGTKAIRMDRWRATPVVIPRPAEQRTIVTFLDRATAKIDALIAKKERLIELLQEKRTALIARAVTKGLDPKAAMKDSGVDWLGEIPAHWEVKRVKRVFSVIGGSTPDSGVAEYWEGNIPWVTPEDLGDLPTSEILSTRRRITDAGYRSCRTTRVAVGSLVLSTRAPIGHVAIAGVDLCTNQGCHSLAFRGDASPKFFYLQFVALRSELKSLGQGTTFAELATDKLEHFYLAEPPAAEQRAIAAFVEAETLRIDTLVARVRDGLDRLKELRGALISAAVTGKIDVREEAAA